MSRLSGYMHDQPIPSKEKAVYWMEYVIRHNGTRHMRMASNDLPFYQNYLLDVMALMLVITLLGIVGSGFVLYKVLNRVKRVNKTKMEKSQ